MYLGAPLFLLASFIVGMLHPLKDEKLRQPLDGFLYGNQMLFAWACRFVVFQFVTLTLDVFLI